jgi:hypothetical protein
LVDDEFRVTMDIKPLNPKLSGDAQVVDECLIFHHIVGCAEVQPNYVEETVSLRREQHYAFPSPIEGERTIEIHALVLMGDRGGGRGLVSLGPIDHEIY